MTRQARLFLSEEDRTPAREQQSVRREARSATPWPPMPNPASAEVQLQLPATATERPRPAGVGPESSAASQGSGWHREDLSYESLLQLDEGVKRVGLKPAQLEKLGRAAIRLRAASGCGAADCCICLDVLDAGAEGWQLPCRHEFHAACISTWLQVRRISRPNARVASCPRPVRVHGHRSVTVRCHVSLVLVVRTDRRGNRSMCVAPRAGRVCRASEGVALLHDWPTESWWLLCALERAVISEQPLRNPQHGPQAIWCLGLVLLNH